MNLNQEHRLVGFNQVNPTSSYAIETSYPLEGGYIIQHNWRCHLLHSQGIPDGVLNHLKIHSDGIPAAVSVEPNEFEPFMDSGLFEVWDEVSDDAIEFPEEENIAMDFASIEHKTAFTISLVRVIPDIPPEYIL